MPGLHGASPLNKFQQAGANILSPVFYMSQNRTSRDKFWLLCATAGLYATAVDTITLPSRVIGAGGFSITSMIGCCVENRMQKIGSLAMTLPFNDLDGCTDAKTAHTLLHDNRAFTSAASFNQQELQLSVPGRHLHAFASTAPRTTVDPRTHSIVVPSAQVTVIRGVVPEAAPNLGSLLKTEQPRFGFVA